MHVTTAGSGSPIVLIHGLAGSRAWWVRNIPPLSLNYRVVLLDLPGFGSMRNYAGEFSIAQSPAWLNQVLSALTIESAAVIGHSMGGLIAALFAAAYRPKVTRLVLAAPAVGLLHSSTLRYLPPLLREAALMKPRFLSTLVRDTARANLITLWNASRELLSIDINRELAAIDQPCLVIAGDRDRLVPVTVAKQLATRIPHSSLTVLPRAGHILMYDQPELFNRAVLNFISGEGH